MNSQDEYCKSGIPGLDTILIKGFPKNRLYVIEGEPGSGKTTMALQFLMEGIKLGEKALYITFSETEDELQAVARSHNWDLKKIDLIDLSNIERQTQSSHTTLFHPSELELNQVTDNLLKRIDEISPDRIVFDSVSEMRLLAENPLRYRKQVLALKQKLATRKATVFFLDDLTATSGMDMQVQSIAHGVLRLTRLHHEFGGERRQIRVLKLRGVKFISGLHDCEIATGGLRVFPRMISAHQEEKMVSGVLSSGVSGLDELIGSGLDLGTSNLFIGPAGTGKSTMCMLYALSAVKQNKKVAFFCFDETINNLRKRTSSIGMDIDSAINSGKLCIQKIDPAEMSPGAFAHLIQESVKGDDVKVVVIDSLNGYIQAMQQEKYLVLQLHELLAFLNNRGMVTLMTVAQHGMIGSMASPIDLTYLADTVILTRFFEASGSIKKAISVIKKRTGEHEDTIREFSISKKGVNVGPALDQFEGILTGVPKYNGAAKAILKTGKSAE